MEKKFEKYGLKDLREGEDELRAMLPWCRMEGFLYLRS